MALIRDMIGRHIGKCMYVFEFEANFIKTKNGNTKNISRTSHYLFDRSNISVEGKTRPRQQILNN